MSAKTKRKAPVARINAQTKREPTHDEIALCAMAIWVEAGRPQGRDLEHWLLAEAHLRQAKPPGRKASPPARPGNPPATPPGRTTRKP